MTKIKNFFKSITNSKKKVFALALSVCVVVLSIASSSIAYFTDTAGYTNTFTSGKVDITLTEAVALRNETTGHVEIANAENRRDYNDNAVYGKIFPNQTIAKDPRITVAADSEDAYLGATVVISKTGIGTLLNTQDKVKAFITGLPESQATVTINIATDTITIYVVFTEARTKNGTAQIFTGLHMLDTWTATEMSQLNNLQVSVNAYAVQKDGFTHALDALKAGFDTFDSLS